jgi:hypothetical protein
VHAQTDSLFASALTFRIVDLTSGILLRLNRTSFGGKLSLAPIVIFAFNRPSHLRRLLNSLLANQEAKESEITIFIDGPRVEDDQRLILEVVSTIEAFSDYVEISTIRNKTNKGLATSVLAGVDAIFVNHDTAIVLEDDLIVSSKFLRFCNEGLTRFRDDSSMASIQGYSPILFNNGKGTYFLKGADCWGWATWKDRWLSLNRDSGDLLAKIQNAKLSKEFDLNGSFPYTDMLRRQARREVDSWAIRWHASMFLQNRLSVYPSQSLIFNTGFDGSGTHKANSFNLEVSKGLPEADYYPEFDNLTPRETKRARSMIVNLSRKRYKSYPYWHPLGLPRVAARKIKRLLLYFRANEPS